MDHAVTVGRETTLLVRAVRRRMWAHAVVRDATRGAWIAALAAIAGGVWHVVAGADPRVTAAAYALVLLAGAGVAAVARRPAVRDAATTADAWLDGRELLTSAWDQLDHHPAARAGAAPFVIARADEFATRSTARLARERRAHLSRLYLPVTAGLAALFLQLVPTTDRPAPPDGIVRSGGVEDPERRRDVNAVTGAASVALATRGERGDDARPAERGAAVDVAGSAAPGVDSARPAAEGPRRANGASGGGRGAGRSAATAYGTDTGRREQALVTSHVDVARPAGLTGSAPAAATIDAADDVGRSVDEASPSAARLVDVQPPLSVAPAARAYVGAYVRGGGHP